MKVARNQACLAIPKDDEAETRGTKNTLTTTDSSAAYVGATRIFDRVQRAFDWPSFGWKSLQKPVFENK